MVSNIMSLLTKSLYQHVRIPLLSFSQRITIRSMSTGRKDQTKEESKLKIEQIEADNRRLEYERRRWKEEMEAEDRRREYDDERRNRRWNKTERNDGGGGYSDEL